MGALSFIRAHALSLPILAKFAVGLALIVCVPMLSRKLRLPAVVGLLLSGVVIGPYGLDVIGQHRPIADFLAELGKLLLMFFAGLEIDLAWIAVQIAGRAFGYTQVTRWTMWSLTLPQVAATLAATLVAYDTFDPAHRRLIDAQLLNVVLVLMLTTSIIGPVLTQRFLPRMLAVFRAKIHQGG